MANNYNENEATCHQIYQAIQERQCAYMAMHCELINLHSFLGLMGFKRIHKYHKLRMAMVEEKIKGYYIDHHNALIMDVDEVREPHVIPDDWYKYNRFDVTTTVRGQYVKKAFETYREWLKEDKDKYNLYARALFDLGYMDDFAMIKKCLICSISEELKRLERLMLMLESVKYSEEYIALIQRKLHKKYKKKMKKTAKYTK